jgi:hypothetical protein
MAGGVDDSDGKVPNSDGVVEPNAGAGALAPNNGALAGLPNPKAEEDATGACA